jgi:hypothetical protein
MAQLLAVAFRVAVTVGKPLPAGRW